jgi:hypothetical protein
MRGLIVAYPELAIGLLRGLSLRLREMNRRSALGRSCGPDPEIDHP